MTSTSDTPGEIRRVLVTRLRFLGDVVMTTPMLAALREAFPGARIDYLTYEAFAPVLAANPDVDRVLTLSPRAGAAATMRMIKTLRTPRVDWWFDAQSNPRTATLVALSKPRHSVGVGRGPRFWFYEHRRERTHDSSAVAAHLELLAPLLAHVSVARTVLYVEADEIERIDARFGIEADRELVLIHPGASHPEKVWPVERWPHVIDAVHERLADPRVAIIAQPGAEAMGRGIADASRGRAEALPALDLRSIFALLTRAALYVGHDGGITHSAVALEVPTVGLLGRVSEAVWFPYEGWGPYRSIRRYEEDGARRKGRNQMEEISVADVIERIDAVLQLSASRTRAPSDD